MKEPMKRVALLMTPSQHRKAVLTAKREGISFGELVREALAHRLVVLGKGTSK